VSTKRIAFDRKSIDEFVRVAEAEYSPVAHNQCGTNQSWPAAILDLPVPSGDIDPFSDEWTNWQRSLHKQVANVDCSPSETEQFGDFDADAHLVAPNAFHHGDPTIVAEHLALLARVIRASGLQTTQAHWLEMGSGWGFCSELLASLGYAVTGVDINPLFATLGTKRAERLGLKRLTYAVASFDDYRVDPTVQAIMFYECLHHSPDPANTIRQVTHSLAEGGFFVAAAEPFIDYWGRFGWGIRNDAPAVYCMRTYGWFESGWSKNFLAECFFRNGFVPVFFQDRQSALGNFMAGFKGNTIPNTLLREVVDPSDWYFETPGVLVSKGDSRLTLFSDGLRTAVLNVGNFSGSNIELSVHRSDEEPNVAVLTPGLSTVEVSLQKGANDIRLLSDRWVPAERFSSPDIREMSFHLYSIEVRLQMDEGRQSERQEVNFV
jgi:SAM-dependent methyltransferase